MFIRSGMASRQLRHGGQLFSSLPEYHGTTILCVRKGNKVVMIGDGQVTRGSSVVVKDNAKKIRRIGKNKEVITGFAGATADCITMLEKLEPKIMAFPGQLERASVALAKEWRQREYRHLQAQLIVADKDVSLSISGVGDVFSAPDDGIIAIGSGGDFALCAAKALVNSGADMDAEEIAKQSMTIASEMCVFTNKKWIVETISSETAPGGSAAPTTVSDSLSQDKTQAT
eukprot:gb/GEZN01014442.1/.p1 GENE.gb/GEZN01014442.1/~~gb/GEZN01014442.1/.p1  ORF type:complete len:229 (+),score=30.52 gb/GEZN01014442.1/:46-732(+)